MIYLDSAASSPLAPEARAAMLEVLGGPPGNPGAAHELGRQAKRTVSAAREQVADLMRVGTGAVLFTSCATEANNLALSESFLTADRRRIVTLATEHASVAQAAAALSSRGADLWVVPVTNQGQPEPEALAEAINDQTAVVSIQAANNETGVMPDMALISELAHDAGAVLHADASQLMAWGDADRIALCDLITVSSHKMYGPQGAAALIASRRLQSQLQPVLVGGGQEQGLRSGTENVAAIAGFGAAAQLAKTSGAAASSLVAALRDQLLAAMVASGISVRDHAAGTVRLPNILSLGLPLGLDGEVVLAHTPSVAASTGSACNAGTPEPSPVLKSMGLSEAEAEATLRLSLSRFTTEHDVDQAARALTATMRSLMTSIEPTQLHQEESLTI